MTHELHKRLPAIAQRLQISRWAAWKRLLCLLVSVGMLTALCGCGKSDNENKGSSSQLTDYEIGEAIREQIEDAPIPKGYSSLLDQDKWWVMVSCEDGEAKVSIKARYYCTMPYVAELYFPIAKEAAEAAGMTLAEFGVSCYKKNEDGIVSSTFASWQTKDGIIGTYADGFWGTAIPNFTLEEFYEVYSDSDFKDVVRSLINNAGGSYE